MRVWRVIAAAIVVLSVSLRAQQSELSAAAISLALQESGTATLYAVQFDAGPTIAKESERTLASIGEVLQSDGALDLEIRVYTPSAGASGEALRLARARAAAIKTYLTDNLGIAPDRLTTAGAVQTRPVAAHAGAGGAPAQNQNGRIELIKKNQ
jgi:outer membrane protein OmpA-like peptidoglycan-associated protein